MEKLESLSKEELLMIEGGNPIVREVTKWVLGGLAWDIVTDMAEDFKEGWDSVEDHEC